MEWNISKDGNNNEEAQITQDVGPELEECRIKIRRGFWTAVVITVLTLAMTIYANYSGGIIAIVNSELFYDVVVFAILAIGIYYKSRVSAVLALSYYVVARILLYMETGKVSGILWVLIITALLAQAAFAAFKYHRIRKEFNPEYKATSKLTWWLATPINVVLAFLLLFIVMTETGVWAPATLVKEDSLSASHVETLREHEILNEEERIELFFSEGLTSILEGGNIVTDTRVISYEMLEEELYVYSALLSEISFVGIEEKGTSLSYSQIYVETYDGQGFYLLAPHEQAEDEQFVEVIKDKARIAQSES